MSEVNLKSGYLEKLGGSFGSSWQKRYFIIKGSTLYWFKKSSDNTHRGSLILKGLKVTVNPLKPLIITLPADKKEYQLKAPNKDEIDEWLTALKRAGVNIEFLEQSSIKRKSSTILTNLKSSRHSRKRSVSDTSVFRETVINSNSVPSLNGFHFKNDSNNNLSTQNSTANSQRKSSMMTTLRPATIEDLLTKPMAPSSPLVIQIQPDNLKGSSGDPSTFNVSKEDNSYEDESLTYSSSSEIQVPVLVEYHESEDEKTM